MKVLIVYDSYFGNTERIARAIGESLGPEADVEMLRVGDVKPEQLAGLGLLIVGSPTRAFRPTPAVAGFLKKIPKDGLKGVKVAAFDTGLAMDDIGSPVLRLLVKLFGYAAKPISDRLKRKGGAATVPPEGFFVTGTKGPLREGELERSAEWAKRITVTR
jgi:flavodoxin